MMDLFEASKTNAGSPTKQNPSLYKVQGYYKLNKEVDRNK